MTSDWTIHPLHVGDIVGLPAPMITHFRGFGETMDLAVLMFLVVGGDQTILVDTGIPDVATATRHRSYDIRRTPEQDPVVALGRLGYAPEDIDIVVNTHLHWDHSGNNHLFPRARFVIQRRELEYAVAPLRSHRVGYDVVPGNVPSWARALDRIEPCRGRATLAPGIEVIPLPGHTPGSQGVLVSAASGRYLLAGDCVDTYRNWAGDATTPHIPSGVYDNIYDYFNSFELIDTLECEVVPSHDIEVLNRGPFS